MCDIFVSFKLVMYLFFSSFPATCICGRIMLRLDCESSWWEFLHLQLLRINCCTGLRFFSGLRKRERGEHLLYEDEADFQFLLSSVQASNKTRLSSANHPMKVNKSIGPSLHLTEPSGLHKLCTWSKLGEHVLGENYAFSHFVCHRFT